MVIILNFCLKEFRFGLHANSIVLVDFLHVSGSIEGRFTSAPNPFERTLGLFVAITVLSTHPGNLLCLGVFRMRWCVFVNKGGQGSVILFVKSTLDGLLISSEARRSVFIFSLSILWYLRKVTVALFWDLGVERFRVKLIQKWSQKASVVWTLEILSLLDLVKTRSIVCP